MTRLCIITPDGNGMVLRGSSDLRTLQTLVGGPIQEVFPSTGDLLGWHAYVNEEGKLEGLPVNDFATVTAERLGWTPLPGDFLCGTAVFLGDSAHGEEGDLPSEVIEVIKQVYDSLNAALDKEDTATTSD